MQVLMLSFFKEMSYFICNVYIKSYLLVFFLHLTAVQC